MSEPVSCDSLEIFSNRILYKLSDKSKLLLDMCDKNDYSAHQCLIAKVAGEVAGVMVYHECDGMYKVDVLETMEPFRHRGVATTLIRTLQRETSEIVLNSLPESVGFYEKCGFRITEPGSCVVGMTWKRTETSGQLFLKL